MSHSNSIKAIFYAFSANLGIAIAKTLAAMWTGSGSLLAEAIHSYADCANQLLLYVGMARSGKQPTIKHPMGFGRESYIWSMIVAFTLFSVGGLFSIYEGVERAIEGHELENVGVALLVLAAAVGMETFSLKGALAVLEEERAGRSLWQWFRETYSSELMVIVGEDIAALLGLVIAFVMLGLSVLTGNPVYDAFGSMIIGILLIVVAITVGREVHSLLLGEVAPDIQSGVGEFLKEQPEVVNVLNVWAINHGNGVMLAVKAEFIADLQVAQAVVKINAMEQQIKLIYPRVKWIFFELDSQD